MEIALASFVMLGLVTIAVITITQFWRSRIDWRRLRRLNAELRAMLGPSEQAGVVSGNMLDSIEYGIKRLDSRLKSLEYDFGCETERLAVMLSTVKDGVIIVNKEKDVVMLNQVARKLFRVADDGATAVPFINLVRDHEIDEAMQKCLETGEKQTRSVISSSKQDLEVTAVPLSKGIFVLVQDLSDVKRLEKIRKDFIINISHELRTPIASCRAIVETLQNGAITDESVAGSFLKKMSIEIDKMTQMVNELSELSRIESGELPIHLKPVNLASVIERAVERLRIQAERGHLVINVHVPHNTPMAMADEARIEQVLVNLIHNAIKFTPAGGRITVSSSATENYVMVSVSDTGIGIPADDLPRIFERFYKVDRSRSSGGTGLGLAISKHIVRAHGGTIQVESQEGKGSTFTFSLPIARVQLEIDPQAVTVLK